MNSDLNRAIDRLQSGAYTCVLCKGDETFTSTERGVKPLVGWLDGGVELNGFSAADKVVGKAAAFLYVLLGVTEVYAPIMSKGAVRVFAKHGVRVYCDQAVQKIVNRAGTGFCPMEEAVGDITDPAVALKAIKEKQKNLAGK